MFTVNDIENTIIINKSKFITNIFYIKDLKDVQEYLNIIKDKYKDATHHCYAYIIDNNKRFSDDKEPNGTAGKPILDCLEKNNLNHVLCIVTRYFGGIKLGASNLLRAYSNSVSKALENTAKLKIINGYNIIIEFDYNRSKEIDNLLNNQKINNKIFDKNIIYDLDIEEDLLNRLKQLNINIEIKNRVIIKR